MLPHIIRHAEKLRPWCPTALATEPVQTEKRHPLPVCVILRAIAVQELAPAFRAPLIIAPELMHLSFQSPARSGIAATPLPSHGPSQHYWLAQPSPAKPRSAPSLALPAVPCHARARPYRQKSRNLLAS